jgi:hypothetical protein
MQNICIHNTYYMKHVQKCGTNNKAYDQTTSVCKLLALDVGRGYKSYGVAGGEW